ncbi:MAG: NAD(P)H-binding protein [Peptococcaceae bacterium]|nr:NAD(P)H-binding protein [Candidatus Syntrophopropionicum ammoniitolerans]
MTREIHVVTGAFGYSGQYIAGRLLEEGREVITLTNSRQRANPFKDRIKAYPFNFDQPEQLVQSLKGVEVLYNTYWVRFNYSGGQVKFKHNLAVENTLKLFNAAQSAGVRRVVHVSITNPAEDSPLEYFSGKAKLEKALINSGLSYAILRPAVLFGREDILINNIAWMLRTFPVFGVFGDGSYRLQPIYVDDLAKLAVTQGQGSKNVIVDAIGPETFRYRQLVKKIGAIIGKNRPIVSIPDFVGYGIGRLIGRFAGDITITVEEIKGLKADLLYTNSPPAGSTKLTEWARQNANTLGINYASELARRRDRRKAYQELK